MHISIIFEKCINDKSAATRMQLWFFFKETVLKENEVILISTKFKFTILYQGVIALHLSNIIFCIAYLLHKVKA